jgi:hypothetical protein
LSNREPKPGHFPCKDTALSLQHELVLTTVVVVVVDDDDDTYARSSSGMNTD